MTRVFVSLLLATLMLGQHNEKPFVRIISPKPDVIDLNARMSFEIHVSDKEDGDSKFGEIDATQVLLKAVFTNDTAGPAFRVSHVEPLLAMMASNCMNCHAFDANLIGPSYKQIGKRYKDDTNIAELVKHVREGSRGVWGDAVMPTHPELSEKETQHMVKWILAFGKDDATTYAIGTQGSLRLKQPSSTPGKNFLFLKAIYRDKGGEVGEDERVLTLNVSHP